MPSRRWAIFAVACALFFLSQFYRASNAVIAPELMADLHLDTQALGLISAAFFYAFALTQIPISLFLDRIGAKRLMLGLNLLGIAGAVLFALADSWQTGLAGRILLGIGMACNLMGTLKLLTLWFDPKGFGTLSGVIFAIGTSGNMAATAPFVLLAEGLGWRGAYLSVAAANLLLLAVFHLVVTEGPDPAEGAAPGPHPAPRRGQALTDARLLLGTRDYWIISFGTFVSYGIFSSFQALWAGPFLMEVLGLSSLVAGNIILLMNLGMILGGPLWGSLSDRVFRTRKWVIWAGLVLMGLLTLHFARLSGQVALGWLGLLFFSFGLFRATGLLMYTHIKERMPLAMAGTALTGINFFTMIGSAVFLHGLGCLMQHLYPEASRGPAAFRAALLLCTLFLAAAAGLYLFARERRA